MGRLIEPDYTVQYLLPPSVEEWVPGDHPARFIREFVEALDLKELGFVDSEATEGRPAYAASLLLKIWLYGYLHRIRSMRKLEAACRDQLPLLWLSGMIQPDHNSLWRFWKEHRGAIRQLYKKTVQVAVHSGCVGLVLQAVDGTKIAAASSGMKGWSKEYMQKLLAALDEALGETELQIASEGEEVVSYRLPAGLAQRQALREQVRAGLAQVEQEERNYYHPKEPQARRMKVGDTNRYAYNAQAVADAKSGIIVACEATQEETDRGQLVPMIAQAQENTAGASAQTLTVADTGYGAGADLQKASQHGMQVLARPAEGAPAGENRYASQHFHYDAQRHSVTCPEGRLLDHEGQTTKKGQHVERFRCHHRDCPVRDQCTRDPKGRQIEIRPHREVVQAMREQLQQPHQLEKLRRRSTIIEPRFAHIKQHDGFRRWSFRGLDGVRAQWAMLCATLNLRILYRHWKAKKNPPHSPATCQMHQAA